MKSCRLSVLALGLILSTAMSGTALAADVVEDSAYDWTGFYLGAHAGYGWTDLKGQYDGPGDDFDDGDGPFDLDDSGFLGGAQVGYNYQIDQVVLGVEADISFLNWKDQRTNGDDERVSFDTDLLVSLRARAGYAFDNALIYATAGGAWTDTKFEANDDIDDTDPDESGDTKLKKLGFVIGGGLEYAFAENWTVRAEGLYYYFGDKKDTENLTDDSDEDDFIKLKDITVVRAGLNFKF